MSNENPNDEIDLLRIFGAFKRGFRNFLRGIFSIISFYKKKVVLFLILLIVGGVSGYFIDQNQDTKNYYIQEVVLEPKYNSTKYIYDFIEEFETNLKDVAFLKKIGLTSEEAASIKEIDIVPLVKGTDVLDNLGERYEDGEFFKDVMEAYDKNQVEEEKYRDFYRHHKLSLIFNANNDKVKNTTKSILNYLKSNSYYKEVVSLTLEQGKNSLEQNKKSLEFINEYLTNLGKRPSAAKGEVVVYTVDKDSDDVPTVTIASLLKQKEDLIQKINEKERILRLDKEVFSIVNNSGIIAKKKELLSRVLFLIPLGLVSLVSFFYLLRYISRSATRFVNEE